MKTTIALSAFIACLSTNVFSDNRTIEKVPRENGAVHQEFKSLLKKTLSQFRSGIGRVELKGKASNNDRCNANFYTNGNTTFVTMEVAGGDFYNEFYIDHPHQSFKKILFQNVIKKGDAVELKVVERDGGYSIVTEGDLLTLESKTASKSSPTCEFSLAKAELHEGETE